MFTIAELKEKWKNHKEKNFLKTYGCESWKEYERKFDPDYAPLARWAHTFYHGYPHLFPLMPEGFRDYGFSGVWPYHDRSDKMVEWCEQNCIGKWRNDWMRGIWDSQGNFERDGMGGTDIMFFAFKEESDYMWFRLVWE